MATGNNEERDDDLSRKRKQRALAAEVIIPDCKNPQRRERCLADPALFMKTYFPEKYKRPFGPHHHKMMERIIDTCERGGRQFIAAPRSSGKSEITRGMLPFVTLKCLTRFPLIVAATSPLAQSTYDDFRLKFQRSPLLREDFPEVCEPVIDLNGAPQRALKQHIKNQRTYIEWAADQLVFPTVHVDNAICKTYGGICMTYFGLDSAFRGVNIYGQRPTLVVIDDAETRASAKNFEQIYDREALIDRDISGLFEEGELKSIAMLGTIQNSYCLSAMIANPSIKPGWQTIKYARVMKWPKNMDLWNDYMAIRNQCKAKNDPDAVAAVKFYLANRERMDEGAELLTDHFTPIYTRDKFQLTYSNLQVQFDEIADTSMSAYRSEYQNDPEPEEQSETIALTVGKILSATSGYDQGKKPLESSWTMIGIDIGKFTSHWVKMAFDADGTAWIIDYGTIQTKGLSASSSQKAISRAIHDALNEFIDDEEFNEPFVNDPPLLVLIDAGDGNQTQAIYDFCITRGAPFYPSKGLPDNKYNAKKKTDTVEPFWMGYAQQDYDEHGRELWRYTVNTEYWKNELQERFNMKTFIDGERTAGSIALFEPPRGDAKFHSYFARSILSEGVEWKPIPNRPNKREWIVRDKRNNHFLDAAALALAAATFVGISPFKPEQETVQPSTSAARTEPSFRFETPYGQAFLATERV